MKKLITFAALALSTMISVAPTAHAGSYYGEYDSGYTYRYKKHRHCYWKKAVWYDDYGYEHYKRVKVCKY